MRLLALLILFMALPAPARAQVVQEAALDRPLTEEDCQEYAFAQEQDACYLKLSQQMQTIEYCDHFDTWEETKGCIFAVDQIRKTAADDCGVLYNYAAECREFVREGIPAQLPPAPAA